MYMPYYISLVSVFDVSYALGPSYLNFSFI